MNTLILFTIIAGALILFALGALVGAVLMHDIEEDRAQETQKPESEEDPEEW